MKSFKSPEIETKNLAEIEARALLIFNEIIKTPEVLEALDLLDDLPEGLHYHNKAHTLDVIKEAVLFTVYEDMDQDIIKTVSIAAAWHDTGFLKQNQKNEEIGVELFKQSEAYKNLSDDQRLEIIANIMDTQMIFDEGIPLLKQQKSIHGYTLDADVSNFGRDDYFEKRQAVAKELKIDLSDSVQAKKFYTFSTELLRNHVWKTKSAEALRSTKMKENLEIAQAELELLT